MLIYFILIVAIVLLYLIIDKFKVAESVKRNIFIWSSALLYLMLIGLRTPYSGNDTHVYITGFNNINEKTWGQILSNPEYAHFEFGFVLLNKVIGSVWLNPTFYLCCTAALCILPVFAVIRRYSSNVLMSVLLWMCCGHFLYCFSAIRQAIAMAICLYALSRLWTGHPFQFIIGVLIGSTMQVACLVTLAALIPYIINESETLKSIYSILIIVAFAIITLFPMHMANLFAKLMALIGKYYEPQTNASGTGLMSIVYFVIYLFALLTHNRKDKRSALLVNIYALAAIAQSFSRAHSLAGRVAVFFEITVIILIPILLFECNFGERASVKMTIGGIKPAYAGVVSKERVARYIYIDGAMWVKAFAMICFLILGIYMIATTDWARANPYYFFWQEVPIC